MSPDPTPPEIAAMAAAALDLPPGSERRLRALEAHARALQAHHQSFTVAMLVGEEPAPPHSGDETSGHYFHDSWHPDCTRCADLFTDEFFAANPDFTDPRPAAGESEVPPGGSDS